MKINLEYYKGKDLYSDGSIESEILDYLKSNRDYEEIIESDTRFPIVYHLSSIRSNIINWYNFKKDCSILEIGAGMGAITATLCEKAKRVVSVELSKQRASAIEIRCKKYDNLELIIGNLNDIKFNEKFDYITLIGVLEYAPLYTNSEKPFEDFLNKIRKLLKDDGKLLIAIENKFGMKYFSGVPEDHSGICYDNIIGYKENKNAQTFGKNGITNLLSSVDLNNIKFYYPLPDYKLPNAIFTDEYLPNVDTINRDIQYYNKDNILNFDELDVYKELVKENKNLFKSFSNSFFIECSKESFESDIKAVFYNNWRKEKYQLRTIIYDKYVIKTPNNSKSKDRIKVMSNIIEKMNNLNINTLDKYEHDSIISKLIKSDNLQETLKKVYYKDGIKMFIKEFEKFYEFLLSKLKICKNTDKNVFDKYDLLCTTNMKNKLNFIEDGIFDLRMENCFFIDENYYFYDQEWIEEKIPAEFLIYRNIINLEFLSNEEKELIYNHFKISEYIPTFKELETLIVKDIKNDKVCEIYRKPYWAKNVFNDRLNVIQQNNEKNLEINSLNKIIEEKNVDINNLSLQNYYLTNSRSVRLARYVKKPFLLIRKVGGKVKRSVKKSAIKLGIKKEKNNYRNYLPIDSFYQENIDFSGKNSDIKTLAFYLPQFHTFKENDEWWGKGFTEWVNAKKSLPRFKGHYQPRLPHDDIGYYDLTNIESIKKQVKLAKEHGIYGFCFYLYWFSGKRLMEKPVDLLLKHPEIDINFCLCWANENFTKKWDGQNQNILMAQEYSKDDPVKFIKDIKKYIDDKRYIRVNNKPVIMVYNPHIIPDVEEVIKKWREEARKNGIGEIEVWTRNLLIDGNQPINEADAEFDFPPLQKGFSNSVITGLKDAYLFDYSVVVDEMKKIYSTYKHPKRIYYATTMAWDNSSRRKEGYTIYHNYSLNKFYEWNRAVVEQTRLLHNEDDRFMFVNAWNEWCEGTYLEPDQKYGYANINTLSKAIFDLPFENMIVTNEHNSEKKNNKFDKKIAVQIHLYYTDLCSEIVSQLNRIPYNYDCYITTSDAEKKKIIEKIFEKKCTAQKVVIDIAKNRGRDVAPFVVQMKKYARNYDYICHIHTKKSKTVAYGDSWRTYLYNHLFGSEDNIIKIFNSFEKNKNLGIIFPEIYPVIMDQVGFYGNNKENCLKEFRRLGIPKNYINCPLIFPAGTMFWARVEAIMPLFSTNYNYRDFDKELNQLDATPAHAIERIICSLAKSRGFIYEKIFNNSIKHILSKKKRLVLFLHNGRFKIDDNCILYIKKLYEITPNLVIISNEKFNDEQLNDFKNIEIFKTNCKEYNKMIIDYLSDKKIYKLFDEIIVTNSEQLYTGNSLELFIDSIENNDLLSLQYLDGDDRKIDLNLFVMKSYLLKDKNILEILRNENNDNISTKIIDYFSYKKMKYDIFLKESKFINNYLINIPINIHQPYLQIILGSPVIDRNSLLIIDSDQKNKILFFLDNNLDK